MSPLRIALAISMPVLSLLAQGNSRSIAERYGPAIGTAVPAFSAIDQSGKPRDLASLRGSKGTWLLFFRSADW